MPEANGYFIFCFILYTIGNSLTMSTYGLMLTPKKSRLLVLVVYNALSLTMGSLKYWIALQGTMVDTIIQITNLLACIILSFFLFKEKIWVCLSAFMLVSVIPCVTSIAWIFVPWDDHFVYTMVGVWYYMFGVTLMVICYSIVLHFKNMLVIKGGNYSLIMVAEGLMMLYYSLMTNLSAIIDGHIISMGVFFCYSLMIITPMAFIVVHSIKVADEERKKELLKLSIAIKENEQKYQKTAENVERLAKIRHDFYDNLNVVRQIVKESPKEGERLLREMKGRVGE